MIYQLSLSPFVWNLHSCRVLFGPTSSRSSICIELPLHLTFEICADLRIPYPRCLLLFGLMRCREDQQRNLIAALLHHLSLPTNRTPGRVQKLCETLSAMNTDVNTFRNTHRNQFLDVVTCCMAAVTDFDREAVKGLDKKEYRDLRQSISRSVCVFGRLLSRLGYDLRAMTATQQVAIIHAMIDSFYHSDRDTGEILFSSLADMHQSWDMWSQESKRALVFAFTRIVSYGYENQFISSLVFRRMTVLKLTWDMLPSRPRNSLGMALGYKAKANFRNAYTILQGLVDVEASWLCLPKDLRDGLLEGLQMIPPTLAQNDRDRLTAKIKPLLHSLVSRRSRTRALV